MQRFDTIGALGNPVIKTPNLDRIVREGTAFVNAYSPSSVCVPARCCMHYGKYPQSTGCYGNNLPMPDDDGSSYVQRLGDAGYRTHAIGKLHFTPDAAAMRGLQSRETQEELRHRPSDDDYLNYLADNGFGHLLDPHGVRGEMYYIPQPAQMPAELHPSQWIGDRSEAFLRDSDRQGQPWYLMSSFLHPHPPFAPPVPWHKLYRGPNMPPPLVPEDRESHLTYRNRNQNRYKYRDQGTDLNLLRQIKAYYYACISFVDFQVGRIMGALEETGQLDNTLIVFSSDHGEHLGDYNCFGKGSMHDTSVRVPMLARLPGVFTPGGRCEQAVSLIDIAPTFTSLGSAASEGYEGLPLQEIAAGGHDREFVFSQFSQAGQAQYLIASKDWSFFYSAADNREYCYHKTTDPRQQRLIATDSRFGRYDTGRLRGKLLEFLKQQGETDAYEESGGELAWRPWPKLKMPVNPDAELLVQDNWWAIPRQQIPGYSSPNDLADLIGPNADEFKRDFPDHAGDLPEDM